MDIQVVETRSRKTCHLAPRPSPEGKTFCGATIHAIAYGPYKGGTVHRKGTRFAMRVCRKCRVEAGKAANDA